MKFRTEVSIEGKEKKIGTEDKVFTMGSCFAQEITQLLEKGQLLTLNNPFGTLFNPVAINTALSRIHKANHYKQEDLVSYDNTVLSLDHHSSFNTSFAHLTLEKINEEIERANAFLQSSKWVILTYGSSFAYEFLPKKQLVGNCHKIPGKFFKKHLLGIEDQKKAINETIEILKDICPGDVEILITVSPVRHTRDGIVENQRSKANLLSAVHDVIEQHENVHYLPIYEIMMDDLRDYRFYKADMIHPSDQAISYIFEKFGSAYFSEKTMDFVEENFKIQQMISHKSKDRTSADYVAFRKKISERIELQQNNVSHKIFTNYSND